MYYCLHCCDSPITLVGAALESVTRVSICGVSQVSAYSGPSRSDRHDTVLPSSRKSAKTRFARQRYGHGIRVRASSDNALVNQGKWPISHT
jgi:hypothetical protein